MDDAVEHENFSEVEGAKTLQAGGVDAVLVRVRAPAVVGVDAAGRTEIMLGDPGVELVARQPLLAPGELDVADPRGQGDGAAHPAVRTVAAPRGGEALG